MKVPFTGPFKDLKERLSSLGGEWDESHPNKKILRLSGVVMSWYETTGTLQFQGKMEQSQKFEASVNYLLYPKEFKVPVIETASEVFPKEPESHIDMNLKEATISKQYLEDAYRDSEIIIGLVSAVGTESGRVVNPLTDRLGGFGYEVKNIRVSSLLPSPNNPHVSEYQRIKHYIEQGDKIRESAKKHGILAYGAAKLIAQNRPTGQKKVAYIINSLKHPEEVLALRKIYGQGFYLIGIHADRKRRLDYLTQDKGMRQGEAVELLAIDEDEKVINGQKTRDTFHLSDFYLNLGKIEDQVKNTIQRFLELIFSHPYKNPTFDEFAMYMAFSSSVRSGDLSRQVGAVIAKNSQIIATGANEVPAAGGGHYWAVADEETGEVKDVLDGKDYTRQQDQNKIEVTEIISSLEKSIESIEGMSASVFSRISEELNKSRINDLTEFGRVVHAEMQAILSCARAGISCSAATLYCTTFPCHNCAKHLIAAGILRVVYVEPYAKSKALEFHSESVKTQDDDTNRVLLEPFIGVGARRFLDFFSMNSGAGTKLKRKTKEGITVDWEKGSADLRVVLIPKSYLEIEGEAIQSFNAHVT